MKIRWRYGIIAGLFLAVFSLYPQMKMVYLRGDDWNGHYAYNDIDEVAYAAYVRGADRRAAAKERPLHRPRRFARDAAGRIAVLDTVCCSVHDRSAREVVRRARDMGDDDCGGVGGVSDGPRDILAARIDNGRFAVCDGRQLVVLAGGALFAGEGAIGEIPAGATRIRISRASGVTYRRWHSRRSFCWSGWCGRSLDRVAGGRESEE